MELIYIRAIADLKAEASRAYLGMLWWLAEPILYMGAFYMLFGFGLRFGGEDFVSFLLCGLVPYKWFSSSVSTGANTLITNKALINLVYVPKYALLFSVMLANFIKFWVILALLLAFLTTQGFTPSWSWLELVVVVFVQLILIVGFAGLASVVIPYIPDFRLLIDNGLMLLFFTSGIFYNVAEKTPHLIQYISFNPLWALIEAYRAILMNGVSPDYGGLFYVFCIGVSSLVLAVVALATLDQKLSRIST